MEVGRGKKTKKDRPVRKYGTYNALDIQLRKSKIEKSGVVTTLLLDTFHENAGIIRASDVIEKGLCGDEKGDFSRWRQTLIDSEWLEYDYAKAKASGDLSRHHPGKKLIKYINEEILKTKQIATADDLHRMQAKLQEENAALKAKLEALEKRLSAQDATISLMTKYLKKQARSVLGASASPEAVNKFIGEMLKIADEEEESALEKEPIAH